VEEKAMLEAEAVAGHGVEEMEFVQRQGANAE